MKRKILYITLLFALLFLSVTGCFLLYTSTPTTNSTTGEQILALNEIRQLALSGDYELMEQKTFALQDSLRNSPTGASDTTYYLILCGIGLLFLSVVFSYIYLTILRPFQKLNDFARQVAAGNLDLPLEYERSNYFGAFTWAFDHMRREITKARACEQAAIEHNKTIIATLSHDIKTPIASIRAYAEGLEAHMDTSPEKRMQYLSVILNKCDQVSALTNDLLLHSLTDLDKLQLVPQTLELCSFMKKCLEEHSLYTGDIQYQMPSRPLYITADPKRLSQIAENIISNTRKYAQTPLEVTLLADCHNAKLSFKDHGPGIPDADMPFIRDKFYRGRNCGSKPGSGLGLYIVDYLTEKMGGTLLLHNRMEGLEVIISFPLSGS